MSAEAPPPRPTTKAADRQAAAAALSVGRTFCGLPSLLHEAPLELLRRNPRLASALLSGVAGVAVPEGGAAALAPGEVTASLPVELRADAVVVRYGADDRLAVVVEGPDVGGPHAEPAGLAGLRAVVWQGEKRLPRSWR
jgi:hypothetical protein